MPRFISIVFLLLVSSYQYVESSKEVNKRLREEEIIPDVLGKLSDDVNLLKVSWNDEVKASLGNILTPTQVQKQPKIEYEAEDDAFYTLAMQDPDAPSRKEPSRREFRHWLIINIPGKDIEKGETIWEYIGSGPPEVIFNFFFETLKNLKKLFRVPVFIATSLCSSNNRLEKSSLMVHTYPITRHWAGHRHQREISLTNINSNLSPLTFIKLNMMIMCQFCIHNSRVKVANDNSK